MTPSKRGNLKPESFVKTHIKNQFLLPALIAGLGLMLAGQVTAQIFTNLHSFTATSGPYPFTNSDGAGPNGLILSGNTLYGTASHGGSSGNGALFAVNTNGTGFTNLHSFTTNFPYGTNSDGASPHSGLILSGSVLYGTAQLGGSSGNGAVFALNTDGTGFTNLHSFTALYADNIDNSTNSDGSIPAAGLILSGSTLYGTAKYGGSSGNGTVFKVNTDGTGFTSLYSFTATSDHYIGTNSDGAGPEADLILSANTLYGTTPNGGSSGNGTVFAININGTDFTNLYNFSGYPSNVSPPHSGLIFSGNTLYGTANGGGSSGAGTVFAINTDGSGFTNLYSFNGGSDGGYPYAGLILSGNTLYGTTAGGGSSGYGTLFEINTDGTGFTNLYSFNGSDGAFPAGLILSGNTLYGTTGAGGNFLNGTVFSLSLPLPQLTIIPSGINVVLTWPTNAAGFTLQSTTNLVPPAAWTPVVPGPVVINGQNAVTNPISGAQQFYRLSQ